jgi:hypothetical protein
MVSTQAQGVTKGHEEPVLSHFKRSTDMGKTTASQASYSGQVGVSVRQKRTARWLVAGVAALSLSVLAGNTLRDSVLSHIKIDGTHFVGDKTSDSQILMADGNNGHPGGG